MNKRGGTRGRGRLQTTAATSVARAKRYLQSQQRQQNVEEEMGEVATRGARGGRARYNST